MPTNVLQYVMIYYSQKNVTRLQLLESPSTHLLESGHLFENCSFGILIKINVTDLLYNIDIMIPGSAMLSSYVVKTETACNSSWKEQSSSKPIVIKVRLWSQFSGFF